MKRIIAWVVLLVIVLSSHGLVGAAPAVPKPSAQHFYVLDQANVLSDVAEGKIQATSAQLAGKTKAQVVVLTVRTMGDTPIEDYALAVLRQWGIGDKQLNNGVLILVAVDDRQSRIEVGYGLEGALPDAKTGRIQDEYMLPSFQNGNYEQGILNGYAATVNEVAAEYKVAVTNDKPQGQNRSKTNEDPWSALPWWSKVLLAVAIGGLIVVDIAFFGGRITWLLLQLLFRGGRGGPGGGSGGGGSGGGGGSSRRW
jgi:uncharacterized protein